MDVDPLVIVTALTRTVECYQQGHTLTEILGEKYVVVELLYAFIAEIVNFIFHFAPLGSGYIFLSLAKVAIRRLVCPLSKRTS